MVKTGGSFGGDSSPDDEDEDLEIAFEDDDEPDIEAASYDDQSPNLVEDFKGDEDGQKFLKKFATQVIDDFDSAWEGSEEYREKIADNYKMYAGFLPKKSFPFENCSNAHVPIMLEGISRLSARTYAEIFGIDDHIFGVQPTGPNDDKIAEILTVHGNWQIRNQLTDFFRQMHRGIVIFFTNGDVTCHSTYDQRARRNRHEILTTDEFVIPYVMTTTEPDYSDCPFKCRILYLTALDLEAMKGEWDEEAILGVIDGSSPDYDGDPDSPLRQAVADVSGIMAPDKDDNSEYKLIYYEGSAKLPGDEEARAICGVVCPNTRQVLRLYVREENEWRDQIRYDREVEQGKDYEMAVQAYAQMQEKEGQLRARLAQPHVDPMEADMIHSALNQEATPAPMPPKWWDRGQPLPPRRVPIEMFSHGVCMENFLGSLGLSYGQILADQNRAANNSLNQAIDQATLGNVGTYLMPDLLEIEPGPFEIAPGVINRISGVSGTDIKNAIVELKPSAANPQLFQFVDKMVEYSQSSIAAPDILSGESGKSGETWRGQSSRTEQALKQLSVAGGKYAKFTEEIFKRNAKLNSMYLPDEEIIFVASHLIGVGGGQEINISRKMYQRDYRVTIRSDMRFTSQEQRIAEADQLVAMPNAVPPLQGNLAWWHAASTRALKARGAHDMLPMLGPPPPPPTTPLGVPPPPPPGMIPPGMGPSPMGQGGPPPPKGPKPGANAPPGRPQPPPGAPPM